jgi:hypothetical protein
MNKVLKIYIIVIAFLCLTLNVYAQNQQNFNGVWISESSGYEEHLGHYELSCELTIEDERYTLMAERVSEKAMFWSTAERGKILFENSEIIFLKDERAYGSYIGKRKMAKQFIRSLIKRILSLFQN